MTTELLVNVSLRFPQLDRNALADHLAPLMAEAVRVGGSTTNISIQPYEPDDDDE